MSFTTEDIAGLFPSLLEIEDEGLRGQVAAVWSEALTAGADGAGWTLEEIRAMPFTILLEHVPMTYVEHLNSCVEQCIAIAGVLGKIFGDTVPIHHDHLIAGALLADVGKPMEYAKGVEGELHKSSFGASLRHPFSGVALCYKHGLPHEVMHIVATHSHEGEKVQRSIESIIFHHADFIDYDIAKLLDKIGRQKAAEA